MDKKKTFLQSAQFFRTQKYFSGRNPANMCDRIKRTRAQLKIIYVAESHGTWTSFHSSEFMGLKIKSSV
jgi:hypothetical protein